MNVSAMNVVIMNQLVRLPKLNFFLHNWLIINKFDAYHLPFKTLKKMSNSNAFTRFAKGDKASTELDYHCVIYTRVSTKEQAEGNLSLETQKKACDQYAAKQHYKV